MEANRINVTETVPASRKLQRSDAKALLQGASILIVAKGKTVNTFSVGSRIPTDAVDAMLGPTGNLRAPTVRVGKTLVVGFNDTVFTEAFG